MKTTAVSTGLSDFHKMIITVMRTTFPKAEPRTIKYRNYSKYSKVAFRNDLGKRLKNQPTNYDTFEEIFLKTLDVHAPQKTKVIRANHKPYVNKKMRKAIMHRSQLQNKLFKYGTIEYQIAFKHQRNYCNRLQKREKKKYYNDLDTNIFDSNKKFWQRVKPLFSEKTMLKQSIRLKENGKMISDKKEVAEILNNYFMESVENLRGRKVFTN